MKTGSNSDVVPLGQRTLGTNDGTYTVSLPKETVERLDLEKGDNLEIGYHTEAGEFRLVSANMFDGW